MLLYLPGIFRHLIGIFPNYTLCKQVLCVIFSGGSDGKESACNAGDPGSIPGSGRAHGEKWQLIPVFLPGECHGQRSLAGYST